MTTRISVTVDFDATATISRPSADYPVRSVADVNLLTRPLAAFFDAISRIPWPEDGPEPPVRVLGLGMALWNHENPRA